MANTKGWTKDSARHALAAKGIKTAKQKSSMWKSSKFHPVKVGIWGIDKSLSDDLVFSAKYDEEKFWKLVTKAAKSMPVDKFYKTVRHSYDFLKKSVREREAELDKLSKKVNLKGVDVAKLSVDDPRAQYAGLEVVLDKQKIALKRLKVLKKLMKKGG